MLVCAAIRIKDEFDIPSQRGLIIPCIRHGEAFRLYLILTGDKLKMSQVEQGFIDNKGRFYTREEAFINFRNNLSATVRAYKEKHNESELYSEDLY